MNRQPMGHKSYGSIAHLPGSRLGPADHKCHSGQKKIACERPRNKHDRVIVQEKLDGSNVGVVLLDDRILPISRAGYLADTSPYIQHHYFSAWVLKNQERFRAVLSDGQRICGEWLLVAHGTHYELPHEPFVAFDIMLSKHNRMPFDCFLSTVASGEFITPKVISDGPPISIESALNKLGRFGFHGSLEEIEGAVWRIEKNTLNNKSRGNAGGRHWVVDFLVKYVRESKVDGKYLDSKTIYNNHR